MRLLPSELFSFWCGTVILTLFSPFVVLVIGTSVLLEAVDRGFRGGLFRSNCELSGLVMGVFVPRVNSMIAPHVQHMVVNREDAFMVPCLLYAVCIPALFMFCASGGWTWVFLYHVIRVGPFFMNFAYVYTLCHKEGHASAAGRRLWSHPYDCVLPRCFNWWVGLFYGVMPASFAVGHAINHHRHNNSEQDVISTLDKPRDSWVSFICYLPRFALYASNISTFAQFVREGKMKVAAKVVAGGLYYVAFCASVQHFYGTRALCAFFIYPFAENVIMLALINWCWHAFADADASEFVDSVTIIRGTVNILNEDMHVVHHQYPGIHWSLHPKMLKKHAVEYARNKGSVFQQTHVFELAFMILFADYEELARKHFSSLSHAEKVSLMRSRLQTCRWGARSPGASDRLLVDDKGS